MKNRMLLSLSCLCVLLAACASSGKYSVSEDEMLYVKRKPSLERENYVFTDRFGSQRIPDSDSPHKKDVFLEAHEFSFGLALVKTKDGKWQYIDRKGNVVIAPDYDTCLSFGEFSGAGLGFKGLAIVNNGGNRIFSQSGWGDGGKYGLINTKGEEVLPVEYEEIHNFGDIDRTRWRIKKDGLYGFIDEKAKIVIPLQYTDARFFTDGLAPVQKNGKWGVINKKGRELVPFKYDKVNIYSNDSIQVFEKEKSFWINSKGRKI